MICTLEGRHFHVCDAFFVECLQHEGVLSVDAVPGAHRAIVRCGVKFIHTIPGDGGDAVGVALRDTARHVDIVPTIPQSHHAIRRGGNHQGIVTSADGDGRDGTRAALAVVTGTKAAFFQNLPREVLRGSIAGADVPEFDTAVCRATDELIGAQSNQLRDPGGVTGHLVDRGCSGQIQHRDQACRSADTQVLLRARAHATGDTCGHHHTRRSSLLARLGLARDGFLGGDSGRADERQTADADLASRQHRTLRDFADICIGGWSHTVAAGGSRTREIGLNNGAAAGGGRGSF